MSSFQTKCADGKDCGPLRVLITEDSPDDAELLRLQLTTAGYNVAALRVDNACEMYKALSSSDWDIVIADYAVPGFSAFAALTLLKQSGRDIPFIIVSGVITEEMAVNAMRAGARDYVLKDNVARLLPAIEREIKEADIRKQKRQAESALRESDERIRGSEQRLHAFFGNAAVGTLEVDTEGRLNSVDYFNQWGDEMKGTQLDAAQGFGWQSYIHPDDRQQTIDSWIQAMRARTNFEIEHRIMHASGSFRWHLTRAVPLRDSSGRVNRWLATSTDIHDRKAATEALIRSEKLAATGRLAAAIAHEVNNPLAAAMNAVFLANSDPALSHSTRSHLAIADQELRRAAHITAQTLGFCRENVGREPLAFPKLIDEVLGIYADKLRDRSVRVDRRYRCGVCADACACLIANTGELRQVVSNLVANGIDAVPDNGSLQIRVTRFSRLGEHGDIIRLTIADNGSGIRAENLKRIFEPFFTTKESTGTGLGLWVTQEIIRKYNGSVKVRSRAGTGTVFCVTLPATHPFVAGAAGWDTGSGSPQERSPFRVIGISRGSV